MEKDNLASISGRNRTVILIRDDINYKRLKKYETKENLVIWIKVNEQRGENFLLQATYRQWRIVNNVGTESIKSQIKRWETQINKWKEANDNNEVITIGDINLNALDWDKEFKDRTQHDKSLKKLVELIKIIY